MLSGEGGEPPVAGGNPRGTGGPKSALGTRRSRESMAGLLPGDGLSAVPTWRVQKQTAPRQLSPGRGAVSGGWLPARETRRGPSVTHLLLRVLPDGQAGAGGGGTKTTRHPGRGSPPQGSLQDLAAQGQRGNHLGACSSRSSPGASSQGLEGDSMHSLARGAPRLSVHRGTRRSRFDSGRGTRLRCGLHPQ